MTNEVDVEGIRRVRLGRLSGGGRESGCWGGKAGHLLVSQRERERVSSVQLEGSGGLV